MSRWMQVALMSLFLYLQLIWLGESLKSGEGHVRLARHYRSAGFSQIRLVGGSNSTEGRVEVYHRSGWFGRTWGTVCGNSWDDNDATVVCRHLGLPYTNAQAVGDTAFGEGLGEIWLDDVGCTGSESTLDKCIHSGWGEHNCDHSQDAGVRCLGDVDTVEIRLVGGSIWSEGRVEVLYNNRWGTVCADSWDANDAKVVCRQLGLPNSSAEALGGTAFGQGSGHIWLDDVGCSGSENNLAKCSHRRWGTHNCSDREDAGVRCQGVCYDDVGCFIPRSYCDDDPSFDMLPQSPEHIDTTFLLHASQTGYEIHHQMTAAQFVELGFNSTLETKIIIHGWLDVYTVREIVAIRDAFLAQPTSFNIIVVHWNSGEGLHEFFEYYRVSGQNIRVLAKELQLLLQQLNNEVGLQYNDVHIIGNSLGAHAAGLVGALLDGQLGRISGLDPATPNFQGKDERCRLDETDALYVDVIHTDASLGIFRMNYGTSDKSGHVDFWPNYGHSQAGCNLFTDISGCSHNRAMDYYTTSITGTCEYQSYPCDNDHQPAISSSCSDCPDMGYDAENGNGTGDFCLTITDEAPYC